MSGNEFGGSSLYQRAWGFEIVGYKMNINISWWRIVLTPHRKSSGTGFKYAASLILFACTILM